MPSVLPRNDDESTGLVQIGFNIDFFGVSTDQLYVNNNGNVTFTGPLSTFTPFGLAGVPIEIIAPFFADVDTRNPNSAVVTYGTGKLGLVNTFTVNWDDAGVGYYDARANKLNKFQLVMIDRSAINPGDFDFEFNYDQIQWETGDASGGVDGLGGISAAVGYSNGLTGTAVSYQLPGSLVPGSFLDSNVISGLIYNNLNTIVRNSLDSPVLGRYSFSVRNGNVVCGGPGQPPCPEPVPEPAPALGLLAIGALGTGSLLKQKLGKAKKSNKAES